MSGGPSPLPPEQQERERQLAGQAGIPLARDPEAFAAAMREAQRMAPGMMAPQPPQRWQCALCVGLRRSWEEANRAVLEAAQAAMMAAMANGGPPPDPRAFLGDDLVASMPQVQEAVTQAETGLDQRTPGLATADAVHPQAPPVLERFDRGRGTGPR